MKPPFPALVLPALTVALALAAIARAAWQPITITNPELRAKGVLTGDGAQIVRALTIAPSDPDFMLWCTDVGGLFRSLDGGRNWEPANVGFHSRGSAAVAVDPANPRRVLVVAANSVGHRFNGVYLSTDQAASWREVLPVNQAGSQDRGRKGLAYDPATFDAELGFTRVAYWSRLDRDVEMRGWSKGEVKPALYRTEDGGETWTEVPGGEVAAGAHLVVHPSDGTLYAGNRNGVLRSTDGGRTWETLLEGEVTGLDLARSAPENLWASKADSVWRSTDAGRTWKRIKADDTLSAPNTRLLHLTVSPADPERVILQRHDKHWDFARFYSHDGGATWQRSEIVRGFTLIPSNSRWGGFAFHPNDPDLILAPGGDYPALSRDGGATFSWAGNGVNNIMIGESFNFSVIDPDVVFLGSQDYATVLTTDGGHNWRFMAPGGKAWGGFNYGAYASTPESLVAGETTGWAAPRKLAASTDGGATWTITDRVLTRPSVGYGDPREARTLFLSQYRSTDAGRTWSEMNGATHVFTHDPETKHLIGINRLDPANREGIDAIVRSRDGGATWREVFRTEGRVQDIAYDPRDGGRYLVVERNRLRIWHRGDYSAVVPVPEDQEGYPMLRSVAVDPVDPAVVYLASARNTFASSASALRSLDGGATWENLTRSEPLDGEARDGAREATWVRVHAKTREPWFVTGCYGVWKYSPPDAMTVVQQNNSLSIDGSDCMSVEFMFLELPENQIPSGAPLGLPELWNEIPRGKIIQTPATKISKGGETKITQDLLSPSGVAEALHIRARIARSPIVDELAVEFDLELQAKSDEHQNGSAVSAPPAYRRAQTKVKFNPTSSAWVPTHSLYSNSRHYLAAARITPHLSHNSPTTSSTP